MSMSMSEDSRVNFHCRYGYIVVFIGVGVSIKAMAIGMGHVTEARAWA